MVKKFGIILAKFTFFPKIQGKLFKNFQKISKKFGKNFLKKKQNKKSIEIFF